MNVRLTLLTLGFLLIGLPAMAQISCTTSATSMAFGNYTGLSGLPTTSTATVNVQCSTIVLASTTYTIQLSAGGSGSFTSRSMLSGASHLHYQIYADSARSQVWGDGTAGTSTISDSVTLILFGSSNRNYTAYGSVPGSQNISIGAYTDTVTVLVSY